MTNPVMVTMHEVNQDDQLMALGHWVWCPGCEQVHRPRSRPAEPFTEDGIYWDWDGNETAPTFSPSYLTWEGDINPGDRAKGRCHSFIRAGNWEFLADCSHALAGQTVAMVPVPDWLVR